MRDETKLVLETFIEKATKLRGFKFDEHVKSTGLNFRGSRSGDDEWIIEFDLPDEKERDAFLLTFRLFIQRNEAISFHNIQKLSSDPDLSDDWKNEVTKACKAYTNYLDSYSEYTVELFDGHPTRLEMLRAVLYGSLAHTNNPNEVQKYKLWTRDDIRANLLLQEFTSVILQILVFIKHAADISEKELRAHGF